MTQMSGMTHDMASQVMGMSGEMSKGNLSAAQQKQMSERMRKMATMMDAEQQKNMGEMRKQLDAMR